MNLKFDLVVFKTSKKLWNMNHIGLGRISMCTCISLERSAIEMEMLALKPTYFLRPKQMKMISGRLLVKIITT